jgi:pSer/pThr/pTyr-binding forkhead associated (FHA) protein
MVFEGDSSLPKPDDNSFRGAESRAEVAKIQLKGVTPSKTGTPGSFLVEGGRAIIGRFAPDSGPVEIDLAFLPEDKAEYISRHHAEIWRNEAGQWFIKDLGSANGTFYRASHTGEKGNWERVTGERAIYNGDEIALGSIPFEFHVSVG